MAGQLTLGGALNLILYNGFQPAAGSSLHIFDWGTLSGAFSSVQLPALPSTMAWSSLKLYTPACFRWSIPTSSRAIGTVIIKSPPPTFLRCSMR